MNRFQKAIAILGLIVAVFACIAGWLAIPQIQQLFSAKANNSAGFELDGTWKGKTAHGDDISFVVNGDEITELHSGFVVLKMSESAYCPPRGSFGGRQAHLELNSFTQIVETTYLRIEVTGTFESSSSASGALSSPGVPFDNEGCDVVSTTWRATKQ